MRIHIENMPFEKVASILTGEAARLIVREKGYTSASLVKYIRSSDVDDAFLEALKIIMALPETPSIGFS